MIDGYRFVRWFAVGLVFLTMVFLLTIWALAADAPNRKEIELELRAVQAEKDKYLAELSYGQRMVEDAQKRLPQLFLSEKNLLDMLKQLQEQK